MADAKKKTAKAARKARAKGEKAKTKAGKKTASSLVKRSMSVALMVLAVGGCQLTPSRSQTLTVRDCTINVYGSGSDTNALASVEIATQAMAIETGGNETNSPTATTDISPDIDTTVGGAGGGVLESAVKSVKGIASGECADCGI